LGEEEGVVGALEDGSGDFNYFVFFNLSVQRNLSNFQFA